LHTSICLIIVFSAALILHGYVVRRRLDFVQNTLLIGACALMLWPTLVAQAVGAVVAIVLFMWLRREAPSKAAI
jgi:TRAP-type uncharacterized transport system fused permease subunit